MVILAIGPNVWGRGTSVTEALKNMKKQTGKTPKEYLVYAGDVDDAWVDQMGYIRWKPADAKFEEIDRKGIKE